MGKIKLDSSSWSLEVFNYSSTVDLIGKLQAMSLKDTDLQPFKKLNKTIGDFNTSVNKFKDYTSNQSKNMQMAAHNKMADDAAGAKSFSGKGKKK